jgi:dTMP kinase
MIGIRGYTVSGLFITFEGPEGSGKTTQIHRIKETLTQHHIAYQLVREPGGTVIGDLIRDILLDPNLCDMKPRTETLLYAASRAQLVEHVIQPALAVGNVILCDRYVDSSIAYQGYGMMQDVDEIIKLNHTATGGLFPHRTYLLDIPEELLYMRVNHRGRRKDRIELKDKEFHSRVREGYLALASAEPERFLVIGAQKGINEVFKEIIRDLSLYLPIPRI